MHGLIEKCLQDPQIRCRWRLPQFPSVLLSVVGWYGQWEWNGAVAFIFSTVVPDAGGQVLLVYVVTEHVGVWDHSLPLSMTWKELVDVLAQFQTMENRRVWLQPTPDRTGVCSPLYGQKKHQLWNQKQREVLCQGRPKPGTKGPCRWRANVFEPVMEKEHKTYGIADDNRRGKTGMEDAVQTHHTMLDRQDGAQEDETEKDHMGVHASIQHRHQTAQ